MAKENWQRQTEMLCRHVKSNSKTDLDPWYDDRATLQSHGSYARNLNIQSRPNELHIRLLGAAYSTDHTTSASDFAALSKKIQCDILKLIHQRFDDTDFGRLMADIEIRSRRNGSLFQFLQQDPKAKS